MRVPLYMIETHYRQQRRQLQQQHLAPSEPCPPTWATPRGPNSERLHCHRKTTPNPLKIAEFVALVIFQLVDLPNAITQLALSSESLRLTT